MKLPVRVDEAWVEQKIHKIGGAWLVVCGLVLIGWQVYYPVLKLFDLRILRWHQVLFPIEGIAWVRAFGVMGMAILPPIGFIISGILLLCYRSERRQSMYAFLIFLVFQTGDIEVYPVEITSQNYAEARDMCADAIDLSILDTEDSGSGRIVAGMCVDVEDVNG